MNRARLGHLLLGAVAVVTGCARKPPEPTLADCLAVIRTKQFVDLMRNEDAKGVAHYPGWSQTVLKYLYEERKITASGHETTDTDPGVATSKGDYSLETYILGTDHYQIELLANLDQVPQSGAIAVVTFPKPKAGSGFPARVFAILP
jgi:kynurenine formamidase